MKVFFAMFLNKNYKYNENPTIIELEFFYFQTTQIKQNLCYYMNLNILHIYMVITKFFLR